MKKFRKIVALLLTTALFASSTAVFAQDAAEQEKPTETAVTEESTEETMETDDGYDIPEKVEIIFKVGDDILRINGEDVKVETAPYVVGEGTTLVPVRVITEAFGAKVGWDGETRTVTLDYPDVNIILQIGNPIAEVNGEAVTLLAAPELPDGRTMVPLRFISENFGADVGYDEETRGISVIKEALPEGDTVEGVVDTKYIGDSYFGWTMENPKDLSMVDREFDGSYTEFADEDLNSISIFINEKGKDYDFEEEFKDNKEFYADFATLVKAEKNTDNKEVSTMLFHARTSTAFLYSAVYVTDKYEYVVELYVDNKDEIKNKFIALAQTFSLKFEETDTHDLSNLEDGMRKFESEEMNFTLKLPANMTGGADSRKVNMFSFISNGETNRLRINIEIISKSEAVMTPVGYVEDDIERATNGANLNIMKIGEMQKKTYNDIEIYSYDINVSGSKSGDRYGTYLAFELGEYVYLINILVDAGYDIAPETVIASILDNMEFRNIDQEKVGIIMDSREADIDKSDKEIKVENLIFTTPYYYEQPYTGATGFIDVNKAVSFFVVSQPMPFGATLSAFADSIKTSLTNVELEEDEKLNASTVKRVVLNKKTFYKFTVEITGEERYDYSEIYLYEEGGMVYAVLVEIPELFKSGVTLKEVENIVSSIKKAK